jgi:hypothetical protein
VRVLSPSFALLTHSDHSASPIFLEDYRIDLVKDARFIYSRIEEGLGMLQKILEQGRFQFGSLSPLAFSLVHLNGILTRKDGDISKALDLYQKIYINLPKHQFPSLFLYEIGRQIGLLKDIQNFICKGALLVLVPFLSINLTARHPSRCNPISLRWKEGSPMKQIYEILCTIEENPVHKIDELFSLKSAFEDLMRRDESLYNAIGSSLFFYADDFEKKMNAVAEIEGVISIIDEQRGLLLGGMLANLIILRSS